MPISTIHYLQCDECCDGWDDYYGSSRQEVIKNAKEDGWVFRKGKYLCNFCKDDNTKGDN